MPSKLRTYIIWCFKKYQSCISETVLNCTISKAKVEREKIHDFSFEDMFTADYFLSLPWVWSNVTSHVHIYTREWSHTLSSGLKTDSLPAQSTFILMICSCLLPAPLPLKFHRDYVFKLFQNCFSFAMQINAIWAANYWTIFRINTQVTDSPFRLHSDGTRNLVPS